jgi:hypothetical protein
MSAIGLSDAIALLAGSSTTGCDDARPMKCRTPHSPPQSWLPRTIIGAETSPFALTHIRDRQRPRSDLTTAATKSP